MPDHESNRALVELGEGLMSLSVLVRRFRNSQFGERQLRDALEGLAEQRHGWPRIVEESFRELESVALGSDGVGVALRELQPLVQSAANVVTERLVSKGPLKAVERLRIYREATEAVAILEGFRWTAATVLRASKGRLAGVTASQWFNEQRIVQPLMSSERITFQLMHVDEVIFHTDPVVLWSLVVAHAEKLLRERSERGVSLHCAAAPSGGMRLQLTPSETLSETAWSVEMPPPCPGRSVFIEASAAWSNVTFDGDAVLVGGVPSTAEG